MNDLINNNKTVNTIPSYEVAKMMELEHKRVLRMLDGASDRKGIIQILNESQMELVGYFIESSYIDAKGETRKCYECTKMGCDMLANKMTGEKGVLFTAKYVKKFNEMEQQLQSQQLKLPQTYKEALIALVEEIDAREKAEAERDRLIHQGKLYNTTEIAKELGFKSAKALNKMLEEMKIQYRTNGTWVLYSDYADKEYTSTKQTVLDNGRVIFDRKWTGLGRDFLLGLFNK